MGEMTREELSAMTDRELLAYEREHYGDEADTPHPQAPPFRPYGRHGTYCYFRWLRIAGVSTSLCIRAASCRVLRIRPTTRIDWDVAPGLLIARTGIGRPVRSYGLVQAFELAV